MSEMMRLETAIEHAANAAERWRSQYKNWDDDDKFADGTTKREINDALNSVRHTPENISKVINKGWAYPSCDCCSEQRSAVVVYVNRSGEDSSICMECVTKAALILEQAK